MVLEFQTGGYSEDMIPTVSSVHLFLQFCHFGSSLMLYILVGKGPYTYPTCRILASIRYTLELFVTLLTALDTFQRKSAKWMKCDTCYLVIIPGLMRDST